jgi:RNA polymerase sigma-70 factor (ECF subfamily)
MTTATDRPPQITPTQLVKDHQAGVWRYLRFLGCDEARSDDLTQETFLAVLRKPFEYRSPAATARYLRTVARNQMLMSVRKSQRGPEMRRLEDAEAVWSELSNDGGGDYLDALDECLENVTDRVREALNQFYRDGRSRRQIATTLEMSEQGVKTLLRRAREQLRRCVEGRIQS